MSFNTAIFYDVENLIKGYGFSQKLIQNLSLKEIYKTISESEKIGKVAVQRAYANWSDTRLGVLRNELLELGIEPVQVFGFTLNAPKNVADIQLAIDAIDLAYLRPGITTFVIVSGDGGFSSLAKKLHEYGKMVIGCAYRKTTNRVFRAVCDEFLWISDPESETDSDRYSDAEPVLSDPRNIRLFKSVPPLTNIKDNQLLVQKVQNILHMYAQDPEGMSTLRQGMNLWIVQEAVKYYLRGFNTVRFGFAQFTEFMRYACAGTEFAVYSITNAEPRVGLRSYPIYGATMLTDLSAQDIHSVPSYRSLLNSSTPMPIFKVTNQTVIFKIAHCLVKKNRDFAFLGEYIQRLSDELPEITSEQVKSVLLSMVSCGLFIRDPENAVLQDQRLKLRPEWTDASQVVGRLREYMRAKLDNILHEVQDTVFEKTLAE